MYNVTITGQTYNGCHGDLCDNRTRCLRYWNMCDGYEHCNDGSDEANCCKKVKIVCKEIYTRILIYRMLI